MMARAAGIALLLALALGGGADPARGQDAAVEAALAAALIETAAQRLRSAPDGEGRLAALGEAAAAFEKGLAAMRQGLRDLTRRTEALEARIAIKRADTESALGLLMGMGRTPAPAVLTHPGGPVAHLRAGHAMALVGPALRARTKALSALLDEVRAIDAAQGALQSDMRAALAQLQTARAAQTEALREDPGRQAPIDAATRAALRGAPDTLAGFAKLLTAAPLPADPAHIIHPGALTLPVVGRIVQRWQDKDGDGAPLPGIRIEAPGWAQVTAPMDATIRFAGPLDGYDNVVILEPSPGRLLILAGMATLLRKAGDAVRAGEPVGQLGAASPDAPEFLIEAAAAGEAISDESLYLEVREGGESVDPSLWFAYGQ
jgi:septal ring factor EnvC (AmiA/AmiB activator)